MVRLVEAIRGRETSSSRARLDRRQKRLRSLLGGGHLGGTDHQDRSWCPFLPAGRHPEHYADVAQFDGEFARLFKQLCGETLTVCAFAVLAVIG